MTAHPRHHAQPRREIAVQKRPLFIRRHPRTRILTPSSSTSSLRHHQQQPRTQRNPRPKIRLRGIAPLTARDTNNSKRCSPENDLTVVHEYLQCFHSLPPKIQKTIFSQEERRLLQQTAPVNNITDTADQALLRLEQRRRASRRRPSVRTDSSSDRFVRRGRRHHHRPRPSPSRAIRSNRSSIRSSFYSSLPPTTTEEPSSTEINTDTITDPTDPTDSGIEMDESILASFRWLDEEEDLDLSLDSYHKYVADTAMSSQHVQPTSPRRKPSFRRTLSLAKNRNSTMFLGNNGRGLSSSQSSTLPFSSGGSGGFNPRLDNRQSRHVSHRSASSIDPTAQYYQDPEARLKLRVYLASPQKFDEAIEFGFPSLENKENMDANNLRRHNTNRDSKRISQISQISISTHGTHGTHRTHGWTFLDDDTTSIDLNLFDLTDQQPQLQPSKNPRRGPDKTALSSTVRELPSSHSRASSTNRRHRQSQAPKPVVGNTNGSYRPPAGGHRREMTLKMTLTRPDLRTADEAGPYGHDRHDDPLRLAELPPADTSCNIWDDIPEERGVVKKMWRKLRSWRD